MPSRAMQCKTEEWPFNNINITKQNQWHNIYKITIKLPDHFIFLFFKEAKTDLQFQGIKIFLFLKKIIKKEKPTAWCKKI